LKVVGFGTLNFFFSIFNKKKFLQLHYLQKLFTILEDPLVGFGVWDLKNFIFLNPFINFIFLNPFINFIISKFPSAGIERPFGMSWILDSQKNISIFF